MPEGFNDNGDVEAMVECVAMNMALFPWANGRIFLDAKLPKKEERQKFRQNLGTIIAGVVDSFKVRDANFFAPREKMTFDPKLYLRDTYNILSKCHWGKK
jgi:hypothetical protein